MIRNASRDLKRSVSKTKILKKSLSSIKYLIIITRYLSKLLIYFKFTINYFIIVYEDLEYK